MGDNTVKGIVILASAHAAPVESGLIDVNGLNLDELSAVIAGDDLGRALDYIVTSGQNGSGYHGFNSSI